MGEHVGPLLLRAAHPWAGAAGSGGWRDRGWAYATRSGVRRLRVAYSISIPHPCWEDAYDLLMRAYAAGGNRRQALLTYERCVRNLRTQLDIAPLPQTQEVYEALKQ